MTSEFIIDVSETDFDLQVIEYSMNIPVLVDFWAEWCNPCKFLGPILERLAEEGQGHFRLAKVNVDENPNLTFRYNIRSIPMVKAFRNGSMVAEFVGLQPEVKIREFLREVAPDQGDLKLEKALSLLETTHPAQAEILFNQVLDTKPNNNLAKLGLARSLLLQGRGKEAEKLLENFPASKEFNSAENLMPLAKEISNLDLNLKQNDSNVPHDAAYNNCLRLIQKGNLEAAMDGLLDILREDKSYSNGAARRMMVAIFEMLGEGNSLTREYRRELSSVLF